ncbi:MAG TPA: hypothetical protein VFU13_09445 [Steroidobacteraceae bacterium]|nr:hypothetical protein [Steroidobacteraceae bacterium]
MLPSDHDEQDLRRKARAALDLGRIPAVRPNGLWGGHGSADMCPVCGHSIDAAEMELEIEFAADDAQGTREFHLHLPCFAAWEIERKAASQ